MLSKFLEEHIRKEPHQALRTPAVPVTEFDAKLKKQVMRMSFLMHQCEGIGLAANQWGANNAVFVYHFEGKNHACINPVISSKSDEETKETDAATPEEVGEEKEIGIEGCLSIPNKWLYVPRDRVIDVSYQTLDGKTVERTLEGYEARLWLHEYDHLQGILITDYESQQE